MRPDDLLRLIEINQYNLGSILSYISLYLATLWLLVCLWVWRDLHSRIEKKRWGFLAFLFVLIFNFPGLVVYLLMRPEHTIEEKNWFAAENNTPVAFTFTPNVATNKFLPQQSLVDMTSCRNCGIEHPADRKFCTNCGFYLQERCSICNEVYEKGWAYCGNCGNQLRQIWIAPSETELLKENIELGNLTTDTVSVSDNPVTVTTQVNDDKSLKSRINLSSIQSLLAARYGLMRDNFFDLTSTARKRITNLYTTTMQYFQYKPQVTAEFMGGDKIVINVDELDTQVKHDNYVVNQSHKKRKKKKRH